MTLFNCQIINMHTYFTCKKVIISINFFNQLCHIISLNIQCLDAVSCLFYS